MRGDQPTDPNAARARAALRRLDHPAAGYLLVGLEVELDIATAGDVLDGLLGCLEQIAPGDRLLLDAQRQFVAVRGLEALQRVSLAAEHAGRRFGVVRPSWSLSLLCQLFDGGPHHVALFDSLEEAIRLSSSDASPGSA